MLAGLDRIDGLVAVMVVRRGNANHVHVRVGQQLMIVHVPFAAVALDPLLHARPIHVTRGDDLDRLLPLGLEPLHGLEMGPAASAAADEPNAQPLVGAQHLADKGLLGRRNKCRPGNGPGPMNESVAD